jgi:hypothetical protein
MFLEKPKRLYTSLKPLIKIAFISWFKLQKYRLEKHVQNSF